METTAPRRFRYYDLVMVAFVTVFLCANLIGPAKPAELWGFTFGAGVLFFPLSYVFGDILTEVYGYARARRVVWAGFAAMGFAALMAAVVVAHILGVAWHSWRHRENLAASMVTGRKEVADPDAGIAMQAVFIHEMTHVWQYQSGKDLIAEFEKIKAGF